MGLGIGVSNPVARISSFMPRVQMKSDSKVGRLPSDVTSMDLPVEALCSAAAPTDLICPISFPRPLKQRSCFPGRASISVKGRPCCLRTLSQIHARQVFMNRNALVDWIHEKASWAATFAQHVRTCGCCPCIPQPVFDSVCQVCRGLGARACRRSGFRVQRAS